MYVIERNGKLYGPYESYQAAATSCGVGQTQYSNMVDGGNMMGGNTGNIREVFAPGSGQQGDRQSDPDFQNRMAAQQARQQGQQFGDQRDYQSMPMWTRDNFYP